MRAKLDEYEKEYETRVFGPDPFSDAEMQAMRSRNNRLRKAYQRLAPLSVKED